MESDAYRSEFTPDGDRELFAGANDFERLYDSFEIAWRSPRRPVLAEYLAQVPGAKQASVFGHLLALELSYRRDLGERPRAEEYESAFPQCGQIVQEVFEDRHLNTPECSSKGNPRKIWRYDLIRRLGAGGQAEVFLGKHELLNREVVVKLARHVCHDLNEEDRLINEGRILVRLEHPCLGRVEDLDFHNNHPFLIMRYEKGQSLSKLADEVPFSPDVAARIVAQVAQAVASAHEKGIVHLDIKPGNVVLREDGSPCLIDFGLAQMIRAADPSPHEGNSVVGTAAFMSPEQAAGDWSTIGKTSDVFGLGALLFWLLTGHAPFQGSTFTQCIKRARRGRIQTSRLSTVKVPRKLKAICLRALSRDPAERFQSADECVTALNRFLSFRLSASSPGKLVRACADQLRRIFCVSAVPLPDDHVTFDSEESIAAFERVLLLMITVLPLLAWLVLLIFAVATVSDERSRHIPSPNQTAQHRHETRSPEPPPASPAIPTRTRADSPYSTPDEHNVLRQPPTRRSQFKTFGLRQIRQNLHSKENVHCPEAWNPLPKSFGWVNAYENALGKVVYRIPIGFEVEEVRLVADGIICVPESPESQSKAIVFIQVSPDGDTWTNVISYEGNHVATYDNGEPSDYLKASDYTMPEEGWDVSEPLRGADTVYVRAVLFSPTSWRSDPSVADYAQFLPNRPGRDGPLLAVYAK